MKLTINNYKKIIGNYGRYRISDAVEQADYYAFSVTDDSMKTREVHINRNGRIDGDGDTVFHFVNGGSHTQSVTTKWFGDMKNAVSAILSEYDVI
jgi:hypothetical protein